MLGVFRDRASFRSLEVFLCRLPAQQEKERDDDLGADGVCGHPPPVEQGE
jgi:hypothetical protein